MALWPCLPAHSPQDLRTRLEAELESADAFLAANGVGPGSVIHRALAGAIIYGAWDPSPEDGEDLVRRWGVEEMERVFEVGTLQNQVCQAVGLLCPDQCRISALIFKRSAAKIGR